MCVFAQQILSSSLYTVWDSSIVVAKFLEKQQLDLKGKLLLDLSAGCGLPGQSSINAPLVPLNYPGSITDQLVRQ